MGIRKSYGLVTWDHRKGRRTTTPGQMDCHVAWMGGAVTLGDFLCEALVGSISGQRRQRMLETPNRLTSITKEPCGPRELDFSLTISQSGVS